MSEKTIPSYNTSDRPKSAPYLRLKNSKKDFKVSKYPLLQHPKNPKVGPNFEIFHPFCRKSSAFFSDFVTSIVAKLQKNEGGPFDEKKSHNVEKSERGDPLVSPGMVCYAEKKKILFGSVPWANRNNLKFCRTFGRTILVELQVYRNKTLTKSHDYSRLF